MTPLNKVLTGILVAQALLAAITWRPTGGGPAEPRDLLGFATSDITRVTITGRMARDEVPEPPVVLAKTDSGWVIESSDGYPATESNMKTLLENLDKLDVREPIATKADTHPLLEVADDRFTRKVDVETKDGQKRTLYFGAGQGQTAHVRVGGETEVFDVRGLSAWSIAEHDNRYFDREFLRVEPEKVQSLTIERPGQAPIRFTATDGKWTIDGTPPGKEVDQDAARTFVQSVLTVRMLEPDGKEVKPEMGFDNGVVVTWIELDPETNTSAEHTYTIGAAVPNENGRHWLRSDRSPWVLKVLKGSVSHALEKTTDNLFVDPPVDIDELDAP